MFPAGFLACPGFEFLPVHSQADSGYAVFKTNEDLQLRVQLLIFRLLRL